VNLFSQQFVAHAQIGDQGFQPLRLLVVHIGFPGLREPFLFLEKSRTMMASW
jgi:hypothetical protein